MKMLLPLFLCFFFACNAQQSTTKNDQSTKMTNQRAIVETHVISRGRYQYILVVEEGLYAGKYLPEKTLPEQYCRDEMVVKINAQILDKKGVVFKPGPTDIPEKNLEIPMIRVTEIIKEEK